MSGGGWWVVGHTWIVFFLFIQYYVYTHILYTLNIHILCTFSGVLCTNTVYYPLYTGLFTPKFYAENRLLAKPHIYTSFSLYRANPYQCLYRWSFWHYRLLFSAHQFLADSASSIASFASGKADFSLFDFSTIVNILAIVGFVYYFLGIKGMRDSAASTPLAEAYAKMYNRQ